MFVTETHHGNWSWLFFSCLNVNRLYVVHILYWCWLMKLHKAQSDIIFHFRNLRNSKIWSSTKLKLYCLSLLPSLRHHAPHEFTLSPCKSVHWLLDSIYLLQQQRARVFGGGVLQLNREHGRPLLHPETQTNSKIQHEGWNTRKQHQNKNT